MGNSRSPPQKLVNSNVPSGVKSAWKVWRHCMCRNGFYPLIIAPFVTAAFIMDIYVSSGCEFVHINIGITPVNLAWKESKLDIGLFHHKSSDDSIVGTNILMDTFHPRCESYGPTFDEYFIDGDKTWKMSQIIALVAAGGGCTATLIIWMLIMTPLPSCFLWPGVLLPAVLVQLLAGSARFLLFDSQVCHEDLWLPEGEDTVGQKAQSCNLSKDAWLAIATSVLSLMNVLLICLRAPKRRNLDKDFGMQYEDVDNDMVNLRTDTMEDSTCPSYNNDLESQRALKKPSSPKIVKRQPSYDLEEIVQQQMLGSITEHPQNRQSSRPRSGYSAKNNKQNRNSNKENVRIIQQKPESLNKEERTVTSKKQNSSIYNYKVPPRRSAGESKSLKEDNFENREQTKSKLAPSDEGGFQFRSPLKAFKGTFSPKANKTSKWKKQDNFSLSTSPKPYDEAIIFNCIDNLEKQFAEASNDEEAPKV